MICSSVCYWQGCGLSARDLLSGLCPCSPVFKCSSCREASESNGDGGSGICSGKSAICMAEFGRCFANQAARHRVMNRYVCITKCASEVNLSMRWKKRESRGRDWVLFVPGVDCPLLAHCCHSQADCRLSQRGAFMIVHPCPLCHFSVLSFWICGCVCCHRLCLLSSFLADVVKASLELHAI